jgi:hypothetical protein
MSGLMLAATTVAGLLAKKQVYLVSRPPRNYAITIVKPTSKSRTVTNCSGVGFKAATSHGR